VSVVPVYAFAHSPRISSTVARRATS
jgi:hypothetical protein